MRGAAPVMQQHFLNKEESFMYDREASFPMEDTATRRASNTQRRA